MGPSQEVVAAHPLTGLPSRAMEDSVVAILNEMESEDLERLADGLLELQEHPAWPELLRLVEAHRNKVISQFVLTPASDPVIPAHAGGTIFGMEAFLKIVKAVEQKRQKVRLRYAREMS